MGSHSQKGMAGMISLYEEAQYCLKDYSLWSPEAHKELIKRMAERIKELEPKARIFDSWQANSKEVA
jgi:alpha-L-fucosidase